jgi:hypothetical protein
MLPNVLLIGGKVGVNQALPLEINWSLQLLPWPANVLTYFGCIVV